MTGHDDAGRARGLGRAHDRAQIARIGDTVDGDEERLLRGQQRVEISRAQRRRHRDDTLMYLATRHLLDAFGRDHAQRAGCRSTIS